MALQLTDFELLLQANRILSSKLDVDEVLEAVLELAAKVVRAESASLLLLDEKTNELYFDVALGEARDTIKQIRLNVGEGIAGWVARERQPLIVNDVTKDKRFTMKVDKSTKFITRSILAVPLLAKGKLIGVVEAINKELQQDFKQGDREAFEAFASQAAIAIENARLFSEVTREKEKLNTIFAEMSDGIIFLDEDQRIVILNETAGRYCNLDLTESIGKTFNQALLGDFEITPSIDNIRELKDYFTPIDLIRRQAKDFYLTGVIHKFRVAKDMPHGGALVLIRDVTEEKRGEHLKRNFLSLISHKLKTPLTVILGYGPVLTSKMDGLSDFQKKAFKSIYSQGQHLSGLVDKLLRFSLLESESINKNPESKELKALLDEALRDVQTAVKEKGVQVSVDESVGKTPAVEVDGALTVDVFKNLIENAVKFNDKEKKTLSISANTNDKKVTINFRDNGVGIPSEEKEKVFQKFHQIENSFTGQVPGAGLGLALCKKVVTEMGGEILVDSTLGEGTTVSVQLLTR